MGKRFLSSNKGMLVYKTIIGILLFLIIAALVFMMTRRIFNVVQ